MDILLPILKMQLLFFHTDNETKTKKLEGDTETASQSEGDCRDLRT